MALQRAVVSPPGPTLDVAISLNQPASSMVRGGPFLFSPAYAPLIRKPVSGSMERRRRKRG
jgi:hypothetical protein